MVQNDIITK